MHFCPGIVLLKQPIKPQKPTGKYMWYTLYYLKPFNNYYHTNLNFFFKLPKLIFYPHIEIVSPAVKYLGLNSKFVPFLPTLH